MITGLVGEENSEMIHWQNNAYLKNADSVQRYFPWKHINTIEQFNWNAVIELICTIFGFSPNFLQVK